MWGKRNKRSECCVAEKRPKYETFQMYYRWNIAWSRTMLHRYQIDDGLCPGCICGPRAVCHAWRIQWSVTALFIAATWQRRCHEDSVSKMICRQTGHTVQGTTTWGSAGSTISPTLPWWCTIGSGVPQGVIGASSVPLCHTIEAAHTSANTTLNNSRQRRSPSSMPRGGLSKTPMPSTVS